MNLTNICFYKYIYLISILFTFFRKYDPVKSKTISKAQFRSVIQNFLQRSLSENELKQLLQDVMTSETDGGTTTVQYEAFLNRFLKRWTFRAWMLFNLNFYLNILTLQNIGSSSQAITTFDDLTFLEPISFCHPDLMAINVGCKFRDRGSIPSVCQITDADLGQVG